MSETLTLSLVDPRRLPEWNSFVDAHPQGWISHRAEWCTLLMQISSAIQPRYAVVRRGDTGAIEAALPLCLFRSALGQHQLISLPYTTLCDPLTRSAEALHFLIAQLPKILRQEKAHSLQLRTFQSSEAIPPQPLARSDHHLHHEIDLTQSEAALLASFDGGCIRNRIRKALKGPLQFRVGDTLADLRHFYILYRATRQRLGLPIQPWNFFVALWQHIRPVHGMELLLVHHHEKLVGGLLVLHHGPRASAEMLAYDVSAIAHCPNHLVFWNAICRAKAAGRRQFDFGRTPLSEESLVTFKSRWGTVSRPLPIFSYPPRTAPASNKAGRLYEVTRSLLRHSPAPFYRGVSHLFYRWSC